MTVGDQSRARTADLIAAVDAVLADCAEGQLSDERGRPVHQPTPPPEREPWPGATSLAEALDLLDRDR